MLQSGETPLHYACMTGKADIVKLLITKGNADANALNKVMIISISIIDNFE